MLAPLAALSLSDNDREQIGRWLSAQGTPQQVALRSRIVLAAASAQSDSAIAAELAINRKTVMLWRARFAEQGLTSLWAIAPGRGRKPTYDGAKIKAIVDTTLQTKPKGDDPLEQPADGCPSERQPIHREHHLAQPSAQAAPSHALQ